MWLQFLVTSACMQWARRWVGSEAVRCFGRGEHGLTKKCSDVKRCLNCTRQLFTQKQHHVWALFVLGVPEGRRERGDEAQAQWSACHEELYWDHRLARNFTPSDISPDCIAGDRDGFASQLIKAQLLSRADQWVSWGTILPAGPAAPPALKEGAAYLKGHFPYLHQWMTWKPWSLKDDEHCHFSSAELQILFWITSKPFFV